MRFRGPAVCLLALALAIPAAPAAADPAAEAIVRRALERSGGPGAIERAGGLALAAQGT
jgi:hypothetical protein